MNPEAIRHLDRDPVLRRLVERHGPIGLRPRRFSTFRSLTEAIVRQQLSQQAAAVILGRFRSLYPGKSFPTVGEVLATPPEHLRKAGLSRAKASYLLDLAARVRQRRVPGLRACERLTDEELIARLTAVKGIGRWTAEMLLIFNLGRPDVLPVDDLGVRRGFQRAHERDELPAPAELAHHGQRWAPHRTAAALYLWKAAEPEPEGWADP